MVRLPGRSEVPRALDAEGLAGPALVRRSARVGRKVTPLLRRLRLDAPVASRILRRADKLQTLCRGHAQHLRLGQLWWLEPLCCGGGVKAGEAQRRLCRTAEEAATRGLLAIKLHEDLVPGRTTNRRFRRLARDATEATRALRPRKLEPLASSNRSRLVFCHHGPCDQMARPLGPTSLAMATATSRGSSQFALPAHQAGDSHNLRCLVAATASLASLCAKHLALRQPTATRP